VCLGLVSSLIGNPWRSESQFFRSGTFDAVELTGELMAVVVAPTDPRPGACTALGRQ
jgi:hypothetical protein